MPEECAADRVVSPANAISWGALGPQMFGPGAIYHMVPISLAIGVVLPLPFWVAVRPHTAHIKNRSQLAD